MNRYLIWAVFSLVFTIYAFALVAACIGAFTLNGPLVLVNILALTTAPWTLWFFWTSFLELIRSNRKFMAEAKLSYSPKESKLQVVLQWLIVWLAIVVTIYALLTT